MEKRDISYHRHYKQRDFDFAHQLATLRRRAKLTQEEVALRIGLTEKSIRNCELPLRTQSAQIDRALSRP